MLGTSALFLSLSTYIYSKYCWCHRKMRKEWVATVQFSESLISAAAAGNRKSYKGRVKEQASILCWLRGNALSFSALREMASDSKGNSRKEDQIRLFSMVLSQNPRLEEVMGMIPKVTWLGSGAILTRMQVPGCLLNWQETDERAVWWCAGLASWRGAQAGQSSAAKARETPTGHITWNCHDSTHLS